MISISSNKSSTLESVDNENKCWIHTVDPSLIKSIDKNNLIGFKNEKTKNLSKRFYPGNEIFLVTRMNDKFVCYGYTVIEEITLRNKKGLYKNFYKNSTQLKIKRIKYFLHPVIIDNFRNQLKSIKSTGRLSDVLRVGYYKEITSNDYRIIKKQSATTGMFPMYFDTYSENMKEFILNTCKSIHNVLKTQENHSQIEIMYFISLLREALKGYRINKDLEELKRFYSRYANELGFKHIPSRDAKSFVVLLTPSGEKKNFSYISLK
ncbi:MAG: hypothetical protein ILA26_04900 [Methanobrevibacter sp.]|uniref:hypothetical protein n=1 Tax=Methanobrevibacter sp. TaxID=66852 RepID=UPI001B59ABEF|nr:hypothetical protein [Methanobrevibacter sp.]MBP3791351.1 hypothetical protein [Methanobrevibacter sp.]